MGGRRYALDYTPLFMRMDRLKLKPEDWEHMFADIRVIEQATLKAEQGLNP